MKQKKEMSLFRMMHTSIKTDSRAPQKKKIYMKYFLLDI